SRRASLRFEIETMSTHSHNDHNLQPEDSGVKPQPILLFLIILMVSTIVVFVIIKGMLWGLEKMETMNPQPPATMVSAPDDRKLRPEPRLQGAPGKGSTGKIDMPSDLPLDEKRKYFEDTKEKSESYGWINQEGRVARIPIERAKELIVENGLPMRPETSITEI